MYQEYKRLLKIRKYFVIFTLFGNPFFLFCIFQLLTYFNVNISVTTLVLIIVALLLMLFSSFFFLSKDICPWCKESFFTEGFGTDGISLVFRRNCKHCGMPKKVRNSSY